MKTIKYIIALTAVLTLLVGFTENSQANGYFQAFSTTNSIDNGTTIITAWPTNAATTNGITWVYTNLVTAGSVTNAFYTNVFYPGQLTGKCVEIGNQEHVTLNVQGFLVNTGAAVNVYVDLRTAMAQTGSPPGANQNAANLLLGINTNVFLSANLAGLAANDFETSARWISIPIPATTTNWFNWSTNLLMDISPGSVPDANWVGIYQISNTFPANCYLLNPKGPFGLNKKLIPAPLIGQ